MKTEEIFYFLTRKSDNPATTINNLCSLNTFFFYPAFLVHLKFLLTEVPHFFHTLINELLK